MKKKINKENSKKNVFWNLFPVKNPIKLSVHVPYVINSCSKKEEVKLFQSHRVFQWPHLSLRDGRKVLISNAFRKVLLALKSSLTSTFTVIGFHHSRGVWLFKVFPHNSREICRKVHFLVQWCGNFDKTFPTRTIEMWIASNLRVYCENMKINWRKFSTFLYRSLSLTLFLSHFLFP